VTPATSTSSSTSGVTRASSLTSNVVYAYDASQAFAALKAAETPTKADVKDPTLFVPAPPQPQGGSGAAPSVEAPTGQIEINDRKRQRQIEIQKHSVVFSKSNTGPTASYMGVCRLPYQKGSTGTRSEHRHRRIDIKSFPRSCIPFAMLYFTGETECAFLNALSSFILHVCLVVCCMNIGSAHFNRSMRLYCRQKNLTLNDKVFSGAHILAELLS
jgi:hypothetical protein